MFTPKRMLVAIVVANLALITFALLHGLMHHPVVNGVRMPGNPSRYFGEGRYTTLVSCLQLLAVAFFALRTWGTRRAHSQIRNWRAGFTIWALVGAGFVFLACDD